MQDERETKMKVLDRSWINCVRMWKWISENLPNGFSESTDSIKRFIINHLKLQWLRENKFTKPLYHDCFFCDYDGKHGGSCEFCPAALVKEEFDCMENGFHYALDPMNFYHRILKLSKMRGRNV